MIEMEERRMQKPKLSENVSIPREELEAFLKESNEYLEEAMGGPDELARLTGSAAYERFTGPQIARIILQCHSEWMACERISLVSSFASSLLLQSYAPIDAADASGMNLMDLRNRVWLPTACACVAGSATCDLIRSRLMFFSFRC